MEQQHNPPLLVRRFGTVAKAVATAAIGVAKQSPRKPTEPLSFDSWPLWAKDLAKDRQPADKGVGDTLVHIIGDSRSEAFRKRFEDLVGSSCGCADRQAWLNQKFPYL